MIYLINKIQKKKVSEEEIEYSNVVLFAEAESLLDATEKTVNFLKENSEYYKINEGGFFVAKYQMEEPVEVTIK